MPVVVDEMTVEPAASLPAQSEVEAAEPRMPAGPAAFAERLERAARIRAERCERLRAD